MWSFDRQVRRSILPLYSHYDTIIAWLLSGVALNSDNDTWFMNTWCIHIYDMYNTYACIIQVVSNMLFSGSSY